MKLVMRQNQNTLTDDQKYDFARVVRALKSGGTYDEFFVKVHRDSRHADDSNDAHRGPAFFPWHREFLIRFEGALQYYARRIDPPIPDSDLLGLPYWDWSVDSSPNSSIWGSSGFLGGNGDPVNNYRVPSGPFAFKSGWTLTYTIPSEEPTNYLRRRFGPGPGNPGTSLPTPQDVTDTLNETAYDVAPWNINSASGFCNRAEGWSPYGMHNLIHIWVGGSMVPITSPNDPVFFLHHCFVDKLWADWQSLHPNVPWYLPDGGAAPGHNLKDLLRPWNDTTPEDVIDHRRHGYRYDTESYLQADEDLYPTQYIWSPSRTYSLNYYDDGSLWLYKEPEWTRIWNSPGKADLQSPDCKCSMKSDGNLVSYDPKGGVIWSSGTDATQNKGCYLWVSDDGYVELYRPGASKPFWRNGDLLP
jgi:hypothetical protein